MWVDWQLTLFAPLAFDIAMTGHFDHLRHPLLWASRGWLVHHGFDLCRPFNLKIFLTVILLCAEQSTQIMPFTFFLFFLPNPPSWMFFKPLIGEGCSAACFCMSSPVREKHGYIPLVLLTERGGVFLECDSPSIPCRSCRYCWSSCWSVGGTALGSPCSSYFVPSYHTWPPHHLPCEFDGTYAISTKHQPTLFPRRRQLSFLFLCLLQLPLGSGNWKEFGQDCCWTKLRSTRTQ